MIKRMINKWFRRKTKNYTEIPLFWVTFNYQKYKSDGKQGSCMVHVIDSDIGRDPEVKRMLNECIDYIRDNFDPERIKEI